MTLCKNCMFYKYEPSYKDYDHSCEAEEVQITTSISYITGISTTVPPWVGTINTDGKCKFYKKNEDELFSGAFELFLNKFKKALGKNLFVIEEK